MSNIEGLLNQLELHYTKEDVEKIQSNILLLERNNLSKISERLMKQNKPHKFLETLTEVNFTAQLLCSFSLKSYVKIEYEPQNQKRPVDLVIQIKEINYFLQIKSLSNSVRKNTQAQIIRNIRKNISQIQTNRGFYLRVSSFFTKDHVNDLLKFISDNFSMPDGEEFIFLIDGNVAAIVSLETPKNKTREHLVLYSFGDIDAVDITGMTRDQVKNGLMNAAGAFENNNDSKTINLIVTEIRNDRKESIDFAEALYGTEYVTFHNSKQYKHRDNDGLFLEASFSNKVAGIIVIHRSSPELASDYDKVICTNPSHDYLNAITNLVHGKIIERFTWIQEGFFH